MTKLAEGVYYIKYIKSHPTSFLARALNFNPIMFYTNGSRNLDYTKNLMEKMLSVTQECLSKYQHFITKLENHENYYRIMPFVGNSYSSSMKLAFHQIFNNQNQTKPLFTQNTQRSQLLH